MDAKDYEITQNRHILNSLFFNHDRNPAHHSALETSLILLSLASDEPVSGASFHDEVEKLNLDKKLEIIGDYILESPRVVIAPGVLMQSFADNVISFDNVISCVKTKFRYPLLVPVDKGSRPLKISSEVQPGKDNALNYTVSMSSTDLFNRQLQTTLAMSAVAFPKTVSESDIYEKYVTGKFTELEDDAKDPIHSLSHKTFISSDDDDAYWKSIQNTPSRRNGGFSQLELLAKLPRILSIEVDEIEKNPPRGYETPQRNIEPFMRYVEREKEYGRLNGKTVEERALELSKKRKYIYARQSAYFNPMKDLQTGENFELKISLVNYNKAGLHKFVSGAYSGDTPLFLGETTVLAGPMFTDRLINYLFKINYSVDLLQRFKHKMPEF